MNPFNMKVRKTVSYIEILTFEMFRVFILMLIWSLNRTETPLHNRYVSFETGGTNSNWKSETYSGDKNEVCVGVEYI